MTNRPILFSAPMVRAILEGRKTCTRRVLKPQPYSAQSTAFYDAESNSWMSTEPSPITGGTRQMDPWRKMKFAVGDTLWVREAWRVETGDRNHVAPRDLPSDTKILFDANADWNANTRVGKLRPGMFMCRWMSRITLRVTSIKVERLQDISEMDARAEGCGDAKHQDMANLFAAAPSAYAVSMSTTGIDPVTLFEILWESINGPGSWDQNPYVVAIGFEVVK